MSTPERCTCKHERRVHTVMTDLLTDFADMLLEGPIDESALCLGDYVRFCPCRAFKPSPVEPDRYAAMRKRAYERNKFKTGLSFESDKWLADVLTLLDENARLRAALERIGAWECQLSCSDLPGAAGCMSCIARRALQGDTE